MYMANMAWNSSMNPGEASRMMADKDPATGEYRIPHMIYADAFASEMVAYADLVLPRYHLSGTLGLYFVA